MALRYQQQKISAVIFDMDQLLVDTSGIWEESAKLLMTAIGAAWTPEISYRYRGKDAAGVVETIFSLFAPELSLNECHRRYRTSLLAAFGHNPIKALPGADLILAYLHNKVPLALASGSPEKGIARVLEECKWSKYFDIVLSSEKAGSGKGKPAPDVFLETAEQLGCRPRNCLILEDSLAGVQAALNASMHCIAVPSANAGEIDKLNVKIFHSLKEVCEILEYQPDDNRSVR
ncbi:MAG: HAD family phosphatase [Victivallaceae bacterium]|nr:HAD family phosphatase [Victivallaceae bacterium]